ncbi:MAG: cytochrome P460 family protein [Gemmatimonadetes bacterium]|nr:cytochrome P460 family protein [Gemmatimonadota bacterium]
MRDAVMRAGVALGMVVWAGWTSACTPAESAEDEATATEAPAAVVATTAPAPDTTGEALWAHMQGEDYRDTWDLWPGLEAFYAGNDPHGNLLTTYTNAIAAEALASGSMVMPEGAVIIKENYMPTRELAAITVMYKRAGYNPDHSDWFFAKYRPDGTLDAAPTGMALEGRVPGCQSCHIGREPFDYLFSPRPGM